VPAAGPSGVSLPDPSRDCASGRRRATVAGMDRVVRVPEPGDGDERGIVVGWLAFYRNALEAKCAELDADALAARSAPPSRLSLLGLVRHLTEMERAYGAWALGPASELRWVWGEYTADGPERDVDCDASMVEDSMAAWHSERRAVDDRIAALPDLSAVAAGNGRTARWNLQKLVGEYARHNGHADLLRERIDGRTGE
jgi:Protein of unknown function (DUF664)